MKRWDLSRWTVELTPFFNPSFPFVSQVHGSKSGYCKFLVTHGEDWQVLDGLEEGVTHLSKRSPGIDTSFVWNFPISVAYRSTNIFGWPQIVLSIYDVDNLGRWVNRGSSQATTTPNLTTFFSLSSLPSVFLARRDIVLGYGSVHIPTAPGTYNLKVRLYKPLASSLLQHLTSWITKVQPEFVDPKFPTQTEGREVVRAQSSGHAIVTVNVMTRVSPLFSLSLSVSLWPQNLTQLARSFLTCRFSRYITEYGTLWLQPWQVAEVGRPHYCIKTT